MRPRPVPAELGRHDIRSTIKALVDASAFPEGIRGYRARVSRDENAFDSEVRRYQSQTSERGGRPTVGYDLTEEQALIVLQEMPGPAG